MSNFIVFTHKDSSDVMFRQSASEPLPPWAVEVKVAPQAQKTIYSTREEAQKAKVLAFHENRYTQFADLIETVGLNIVQLPAGFAIQVGEFGEYL